MGGYLLHEVATGNTVYDVLMSMTTGKIWNGAAMVDYDQADLADYAIPTVEQSGSGRYILAVPGGLPDDNYWASPYLETVSPGTPTWGDTPIDIQRFGWRDGNIVDLASGLNMAQIDGSDAAAEKLAVSAGAMVIGAAEAGTLSDSQMTTDLSATVANIYAGRVLYFTSGANAGLAVLITAYVVADGLLTFIAFNNQPAPSAPSAADTFIII